MDQITHNVRRTQWLSIINACQNRSEGTTVKAWLAENGIKNKAYYYWLRKFRKEAYAKIESSTARQLPDTGVSFAELSVPKSDQDNSFQLTFNPDAVIKSGDCVIALSNSISRSLLKGIMEGLCNAR